MPDGAGDLGVEVDGRAPCAVDCEIWEDDGTEEFRRVWRVEREGYWFEAAGGGKGPTTG